MSLQRSFGPVSLQRVGVRYDHGMIALLLDGGLAAGPLTLGLQDLQVGFDLDGADPWIPEFGLAGLTVAYNQPPLTIAGSLANLSPGGGAVAFEGGVVIEAEAFSLEAFGYYGDGGGRPLHLAVPVPRGRRRDRRPAVLLRDRLRRGVRLQLGRPPAERRPGRGLPDDRRAAGRAAAERGRAGRSEPLTADRPEHADRRDRRGSPRSWASTGARRGSPSRPSSWSTRRRCWSSRPGRRCRSRCSGSRPRASRRRATRSTRRSSSSSRRAWSPTRASSGSRPCSRRARSCSTPPAT